MLGFSPSAAAWPNIKAVADFYKSNISVAMHTFPLPYHNNGFMAAQAAHVAMNAQPNNVGLFRQIGDFFFNGVRNRSTPRCGVLVARFNSIRL